jgi:Magnesium chelatase, subunit ChlI
VRCPCGFLGDPRHACKCSAPLIERYMGRISGPLLDRTWTRLHIVDPLHRLTPPGGRGTRRGSEGAGTGFILPAPDVQPALIPTPSTPPPPRRRAFR